MEQSELRSILIVDDEVRIRRLQQMYLEKEGFHIDEEEDGSEVCTMLTESDEIPILMLTAKGMDEYVVKPISPREIIYRATTRSNIVFPHLVIEHEAHRVSAGGKEVSLTPKEYELLHYLATSPDKMFTRKELLKEVWNNEYCGNLRTVDTHVKRLRQKLYKISSEAASMITTVWGFGYKIVVPK